jgi:hypothetical protein
MPPPLKALPCPVPLARHRRPSCYAGEKPRFRDAAIPRFEARDSGRVSQEGATARARPLSVRPPMASWLRICGRWEPSTSPVRPVAFGDKTPQTDGPVYQEVPPRQFLHGRHSGAEGAASSTAGSPLRPPRSGSLTARRALGHEWNPLPHPSDQPTFVLTGRAWGKTR